LNQSDFEDYEGDDSFEKQREIEEDDEEYYDDNADSEEDGDSYDSEAYRKSQKTKNLESKSKNDKSDSNARGFQNSRFDKPSSLSANNRSNFELRKPKVAELG
jgi:hypothetical protein